VEFVEAPAFTRHLASYLDDSGYLALQLFLAESPDAGDMIPGAGGVRKLRWTDQRRGKGKRGGLRVIYYFIVDANQIWLFTIYGKNEADDLSASEKQQFKAAVAAELAARRAAKPRQRRR
jgi:mRNA-degrading endonuclease RelE of RelBE toxin-antitoxin system